MIMAFLHEQVPQRMQRILDSSQAKTMRKNNNNIVRGVYCPFVGTNQDLKDNAIYTIRVNNYSQAYETQYFKIRGNDLSPFMAISPRYELEDKDLNKVLNENGSIVKYEVPTVFRGDCFTATVTIRINTNFIDSEVPTNDMIVNPNTWKDGYKGYSQTSTEDWKDINRADINTVPMGQWFTYKCLSNYNLGLRSENRQNVEEMALMGNARSFYPLQGMTVAPVSKIPESQLLNAGYSTSLPLRNTLLSQMFLMLKTSLILELCLVMYRLKMTLEMHIEYSKDYLIRTLNVNMEQLLNYFH